MPLHHLTYGRSIGKDGYVSDLDWEMYCKEVLDSHFDGYTVTDANGCWKSQHERTKQVSIDTDNQDAIEKVAFLYKDMFNQESVGWFITPSMEFI